MSETLTFNIYNSDKPNTLVIKALKWYSCLETLKQAYRTSGAVYNFKQKYYEIFHTDLEVFKRELEDCGFPVVFNFFNAPVTTTKELLLNRIKDTFDYELLKFKPLEGKAPFEEYQEEDITRACNQNRFLFNWGTGTGKSYATSYLMQRSENKGLADKYLVITTKVGCINLKNEILKFTKTFKDEDFFVCSSVTDLEDRTIFNSDYKVIILNYDTLRNVSDHYYKLKHGKSGRGASYRKNQIDLDQWTKGKQCMLFLDESHNIANANSKIFKVTKMLCDAYNIKYRYIFTATFAHKFEQMYTQLTLIDPYTTKNQSYQTWCAFYNKIGTKYNPYAVNKFGWRADRLSLLNDLIYKQYAAKRLSKDVLDVKEMLYMPTIKIKMSYNHRNIYKDFVEEYFHILQKDSESQKEKRSLSEMVRKNIIAFQACVDNPAVILNNPRFDELSIDLQNRFVDFDWKDECTKIEYLKELIEQKTEQEELKGIIWFLHQKTGDALHELIKQPHHYVYSGMEENSNAIVEDFKKSKDSKILLASLNALNTSVTITQAKFNIWVERTYNPKVYEQCLGRIVRIGQEDITENYVIAHKNSVDALQEVCLAKGQKIMEKVFDEEFLSISDWSLVLNGKAEELI